MVEREENVEFRNTLPLMTLASHHQVESIVEKMMRDGNPRSTAAKFKYLLAILPCRAPNKFGLSSTSGLEFGARILTASADIYCNTKGPGSSLLKKRWMAAFVDIATWMIQVIADSDRAHDPAAYNPSCFPPGWRDAPRNAETLPVQTVGRGDFEHRADGNRVALQVS